jgi:5-methylcytosine-specific restriction protein A
LTRRLPPTSRPISAATAMEGIAAGQRAKVRLRAAWLAQKSVRHRQKAGQLTCDKCIFDPLHMISGTTVKARSLLDVHHLHPLDEGTRVPSLRAFVAQRGVAGLH